MLGMGTRRYEGSLFGVGLSYGYMWSIGKRWHVEATIGVGYVSLYGHTIQMYIVERGRNKDKRQ